MDELNFLSGSIVDTSEKRPKKGKELRCFPYEYVCLDVETTGVNPNFDRIIEISALHIKKGHVFSEFSSLIKLSSGRKLSHRIEELTGIRAEILESADSADIVVPKCYNFIGDLPIVGHNVTFDINFLYDACLRCNLILSKKVAKTLIPGLTHYRLPDLTDFFKIEQTIAHRAFADAELTAKCFERLRMLASTIQLLSGSPICLNHIFLSPQQLLRKYNH